MDYNSDTYPSACNTAIHIIMTFALRRSSTSKYAHERTLNFVLLFQFQFAVSWIKQTNREPSPKLSDFEMATKQINARSFWKAQLLRASH
jgi:hypothetical protein